MGKDLKDDPVYQRRLVEGLIQPPAEKKQVMVAREAKISVLLFLLGALLVVLLGSFAKLRPAFLVNGELQPLGMPSTIEIVMLSTAALIVLLCCVKVDEVVTGNVFLAGVQGVIGIFGIAWMGDTFLDGNMNLISGSIRDLVTSAPWSFALALFVLSILLYSQAATVRALMPLGIALGIPAVSLIAMFPAVNGYFFIPNYPTIVAAINFDTTGTTRIGKYLLNHSFMLPGLIATFSAVAISFLLSHLIA
jgi:anaerobic C4-dicarboxylate transporter DcuA